MTGSGATTSRWPGNTLRVYIGYLRRKLEAGGGPAAHPHRARHRLRAARAMSLRAARSPRRVAAGRGRPWPSLLGRGELPVDEARSSSSQVQQELWQRSRSFVGGGSGLGASPGQADRRSASEPGGGPRACALPSGLLTRSSATLTSSRGARRRTAVFPVRYARTGGSSPPTGRLAAAAGAAPGAEHRQDERPGASTSRRPFSGIHVEVLAFADHPDRKVNEIALPLTAVDSALHALLMTYLWLIAIGVVVAGIAGCGDLAHRTGPDSSASSAETEEVTRSLARPQRLEETGAERAPTPGGELQSDARRARAIARATAPPGRRRVARAAHADGRAAQQHPDLPRRGTPARGRARETSKRAIVAELDELAKLVSDVVELARGSTPADRRRARSTLDEVVHDAVARARRRAPAVRFQVERRAGGDPQLAVSRVSRAVTNVIDNARKWSRRGRRDRGLAP